MVTKNTGDKNKSLLELLNDPEFIKDFNNREPLTDEQWQDIYKKSDDAYHKTIRDHKSIQMSYKKYNTRFTI